MLDFGRFIARHGEVAAQAVLENIERFQGVRHNPLLSLEARWALCVAAATDDADRRSAA